MCCLNFLGYLLRCTIKFKSGSCLPLKDIPSHYCLGCVLSVLLQGKWSAPLKILRGSQVFLKYVFSSQLSTIVTSLPENQPTG